MTILDHLRSHKLYIAVHEILSCNRNYYNTRHDILNVACANMWDSCISGHILHIAVIVVVGMEMRLRKSNSKSFHVPRMKFYHKYVCMLSSMYAAMYSMYAEYVIPQISTLKGFIPTDRKWCLI